MGAVQMGLVRMLKGFQSKVLPPLSPRVVTKEEANPMVMYPGLSSVKDLMQSPQEGDSCYLAFSELRELLTDNIDVGNMAACCGAAPLKSPRSF